MKMRDGHCHSYQHAVIEIGGVCPHNCKHLSLCTYMCVCMAMHAIKFVTLFMCICPVGVSQCGGLVYL